MTPFGLLVRPLAPQGLLSLGDQLVVHACHHHALFLDQTVSDALGGEGWAVRRQAAFESAHALITSFCSDFGVTDPIERLELASELFTAMGHGRLTFELTAEGGTARGHGLHHGASFVEKYGTKIKNRRPVDAFTAGFISAAASLAYPSDWGTLEADETTCVAQLAARPPECLFTLTRRPERPRFGAVVTRGLVEQIPLAIPYERLAVAARVMVRSEPLVLYCSVLPWLAITNHAPYLVRPGESALGVFERVLGEQVEDVKRLRREHGEPVIWAGDFNQTLEGKTQGGSAARRVLLQSALDALGYSAWNASAAHATTGLRAVDLICGSRERVVVAQGRIDPERDGVVMSDHAGYWVEI